MTLRAFRGTFLCAIDAAEIDQDDRPEEWGEPSLQEVKDYLADAIEVNILDEDYGNPVGLGSVEINTADLVELPKAEVDRLYKKKKSKAKKSKPKPSLETVVNRFVRKWLSDDPEAKEYVLDQLGGYDTEQNLEIQYAEVAAVTALMMLNPKMTPKVKKELATQLLEVTRNL